LQDCGEEITQLRAHVDVFSFAAEDLKAENNGLKEECQRMSASYEAKIMQMKIEFEKVACDLL